jgi:hypothetical protein
MAQHSFAIIGKNVVNPSWDGSPVTLNQYDGVTIPQAPNGSTVLAWQNTATQNNDGALIVTSGSVVQPSLDAPAGANVPSIQVNNFLGNNVTVTNLSVQAATPIWVEMFGPGMPGVTPVTLPISSPIQLASGKCAQGTSQPTPVLLKFQSTLGNMSIVSVVGGPTDASGNNAYVFGLNFPSTPPGYTKTSGGNSLTFGPVSWGSSTIFVANMSSLNAGPVTVLLQGL